MCIRDSVANAHLNGILKLKNLKNYSAFNIGTGRGTTVKEIVNTFQKVNNVNLSLRNKKKRVGDIPISYAKCKKAEEILNWKSILSFDAIVKMTALWYSQYYSKPKNILSISLSQIKDYEKLMNKKL